MGYRLIADAAMLLHFGFLCYVALGGFLVWRWPHALWPHVGVCAYALGIIDFQWLCPLTGIEDWARLRAGLQGLPSSGFIDHYLTGVVYPERYLTEVQFAVAAVVAVSWLGALLLTMRRRRTPRERDEATGSR
ncbi:DUF2784 domain-containing protein [Streptomonospora wellingtoniae]|uniref:DUF2784 domain-containing protein n=1 Tax=Streptomonospora wellingtoniae TaxID=3075544 RepID=A0ABU2KVX7_9ACTN|nr:DUF2784 domain-containing protein [Streptomonospora sp. DSM 45055]MDT0303405.1 DUF2784 domain-containing protein [Streptomonospora sp. DSM 45055]